MASQKFSTSRGLFSVVIYEILIFKNNRPKHFMFDI